MTAAYVIARVKVSDPGRYREYVQAATAVIARYGGRFLARGGETVALEGPEESGRVIILEFPSLDRARQWYNSEDYQAVRKLRIGASTGTLIAIEGS